MLQQNSDGVSRTLVPRLPWHTVTLIELSSNVPRYSLNEEFGFRVGNWPRVKGYESADFTRLWHGPRSLTAISKAWCLCFFFSPIGHGEVTSIQIWMVVAMVTSTPQHLNRKLETWLSDGSLHAFYAFVRGGLFPVVEGPCPPRIERVERLGESGYSMRCMRSMRGGFIFQYSYCDGTRPVRWKVAGSVWWWLYRLHLAKSYVSGPGLTFRDYE